MKLKIRRRPFHEFSQSVSGQFITPDALPSLAAYWQKQIIFPWRTVGIKVQVSVCPLAVAHLSARGAWWSQRLLALGALLIQLLLGRWAGCQYHSSLFPRFSHLSLSQSSARICIIPCLRREPFSWVAFYWQFPSNPFGTHPHLGWWNSSAWFWGTFVSLLNQVWGSARKHLRSRTLLGLLWWGEWKTAFKIWDSRTKWDLVAVLITVLF